MAKKNADKELKRLSRTDLLELLTEMSRELDRTRAERDRLKAELENKELKIAEAGNLAEAALSLSKIFEAAQTAADLYLTNVKAGTMEQSDVGGQSGSSNG